MRTPGLGPISVQRILNNRRQSRISRWQDLTLMGVVRKRAWPFITFPGHRPQPAKQLRLDTLLNQERKTRTDGGTEHLTKKQGRSHPRNPSLHPRRPRPTPNHTIPHPLRHIQHLHQLRPLQHPRPPRLKPHPHQIHPIPHLQMKTYLFIARAISRS